MTTTTSRVHPEAISGWSPIGPLVSGMGSSLAFTILTGLAERLVLSLPSAFRTGYGPRCLSAQGQSRDLRHFSPMPTRCGNSALRDMAHVRISPIYAYKPHRQSSPSFTMIVPEVTSPFTVALEARSSHHRFPRNIGRQSPIFLKQSNRVEQLDFRLPRSIVHMSKSTPCSGPLSSGLVHSLL